MHKKHISDNKFSSAEKNGDLCGPNVFFCSMYSTISKEESTLKCTFFSPHQFVKINTFFCSIFILALMAKHFSFLCFPDKCSLQSNCYLGEEQLTLAVIFTSIYHCKKNQSTFQFARREEILFSVKLYRGNNYQRLIYRKVESSS